MPKSGNFSPAFLGSLTPAATVDWRKRRNTMRKDKQNVSSEPLTEREKQLMKEIAELKEANEILKDAMSFFVKDRRK